MKKNLFLLFPGTILLLASCVGQTITGEDVPELADPQAECNQINVSASYDLNYYDESSVLIEGTLSQDVNVKYYANDVFIVTQTQSATGDLVSNADNLGTISLFCYHDEGITYQLLNNDGVKTKSVINDLTKEQYSTLYSSYYSYYTSILEEAIGVHDLMVTVGTSDFESFFESSSADSYSLMQEGNIYSLNLKKSTTSDSRTIVQEENASLGIDASGNIISYDVEQSNTLESQYFIYSTDSDLTLNDIVDYAGDYPVLSEYTEVQ
jgi:hypothetical protein